MDSPHRIDFHFYTKCAKPLILTLASPQDRTRANAWIKRLAEDKSLTQLLRSHYLELLLGFLRMRKLAGPFAKHPDEFPTLSDLPKIASVKTPDRGVDEDGMSVLQEKKKKTKGEMKKVKFAGLLTERKENGGLDGTSNKD